MQAESSGDGDKAMHIVNEATERDLHAGVAADLGAGVVALANRQEGSRAEASADGCVEPCQFTRDGDIAGWTGLLQQVRLELRGQETGRGSTEQVQQVYCLICCWHAARRHACPCSRSLVRIRDTHREELAAQLLQTAAGDGARGRRSSRAAAGGPQQGASFLQVPG